MTVELARVNRLLPASVRTRVGPEENGDLIRPTKLLEGAHILSRPVSVYEKGSRRWQSCLPGHTLSVGRAN